MEKKKGALVGAMVGTYNNRGKSISKGESNLGLCPERTHVIIRLK